MSKDKSQDQSQISANDWMQNKKYILEIIKSLAEGQKSLEKMIQDNHLEGMKEIGKLNTRFEGVKKDVYYKTSLIGIITGGFPLVVTLTIYFIKSKFF